MGLSILITQCLQNDFVAPIASHQPLPNGLHVGREEARRLVGVEPSTGPFAQLLHWARDQTEEQLAILHVRDWHDADDPAQQNHLRRFGLHCLCGTPGAELVVGEQEVEERPNEQFVNSITLNDFEGGTNLGEILGGLIDDPDDVRIGVVGVWTEAKVTFLLYDLLTRCGVTNLATCSALTASASRAQHFNALDQLRKVLGVSVFDSVGDFATWLVPHGEPIAPPLPEPGMRPKLQLVGGGELGELDLDILAYLFRDSSELQLYPIGGGFSGAGVFGARSRDSLGHDQAACVVKLGDRSLIAKERVAFECVEAVLGNDAPTVRGFADFGDRAGIKYAYAAMGSGEGVRTFKHLCESDASVDRIESVLRHVFDDILGRFYAVAQYEKLPLIDYYGFDPRYAEGVRDCVRALVGDEADHDTVTVAGRAVKNPATFYDTDLPSLPRTMAEYHFVSYVHGDLNGANILLDGRDNVWLIDFFHAHRGHILRDLVKLENDLLYIFTAIGSEEVLEQALLITDALSGVQDLRAELPEELPGVAESGLRRAWGVVRVLRGIAARVCREDRDPLQASIAALRYAVHTMSFDESSDLQKRWAMYAAGRYAADVARTVRENLDLRVDWVDAPVEEGRIGLTICPGRRDRGRHLQTDVARLAELGGTDLVCLLTAEEMEWAGVIELPAIARAQGLAFRHVPILDQGVPTVEVMQQLVGEIATSCREGANVVLHCMGGLGRSGIVGACVLRANGMSADDAIAAIRRARGPRAVETSVQEGFVRRWA